MSNSKVVHFWKRKKLVILCLINQNWKLMKSVFVFFSTIFFSVGDSFTIYLKELHWKDLSQIYVLDPFLSVTQKPTVSLWEHVDDERRWFSEAYFDLFLFHKFLFKKKFLGNKIICWTMWCVNKLKLCLLAFDCICLCTYCINKVQADFFYCVFSLSPNRKAPGPIPQEQLKSLMISHNTAVKWHSAQ